MTPHQRNLLNVRDAIRYMRRADLQQAAQDATLPRWARAEYTAALARLPAEAGA